MPMGGMHLPERFHREEKHEFEMGHAAGGGTPLQRRNKAFAWREFHECGGSNVTTEYTEHTEEFPFRTLTKKGPQRQQRQKGPNDATTRPSSSVSWCRKAPGETTIHDFPVFEREIPATFAISRSIPRACSFLLWDPFRVHLNGNGSASQGGFATLGFVMESFQDSSLSVLSSFPFGSGRTGKREEETG
jgi:hypothetical protein